VVHDLVADPTDIALVGLDDLGSKDISVEGVRALPVSDGWMVTWLDRLDADWTSFFLFS
jgi:hypothetical protein